MSLEVSEHVDHRFLDFAGVELVRAAYLVEQFGDFFRGIPGKWLHFFLVYEVPYLLYHLVFRRDDKAVEHVLIVLVKVIVYFFLEAAHYVKAFQDFLGKAGIDVVQYLVALLMEKLVYLFLLVAVFLRERVAWTDCARLFGMVYVGTLGKIYGTHVSLLTLQCISWTYSNLNGRKVKYL